MKVSLITVTFNSGKTLSDTIQSVFAQSNADIEYIIIDGLSEDNTIEIINEYEPLFQGRLRWISEKDNGIYDAMNKGIRMATGDIVGIINSDDFYHRNDIIEKIVAEFQEDKLIQAIYGDIRFVNPNDLNKTVRYYSSGKFSPDLFRYGFMPAHPTFFTYREQFEINGYYKVDYKIAADYELLIRFLYVHRLRSKYIPIDFMKMRTGGVSTASFKSNILLNKEIVRACKENGIWTCIPLLLLKYLVKIFEFVITKNI
ncbi:MAG: glycosyltransferase family 2 protein [Bacteroides sp.]|uniref:glycosyltransferase family 2 protein n=1 Tax=Bacteroides sp. TaxID=29523 RepID=UPI002FCB763F